MKFDALPIQEDPEDGLEFQDMTTQEEQKESFLEVTEYKQPVKPKASCPHVLCKSQSRKFWVVAPLLLFIMGGLVVAYVPHPTKNDIVNGEDVKTNDWSSDKDAAMNSGESQENAPKEPVSEDIDGSDKETIQLKSYSNHRRSRPPENIGSMDIYIRRPNEDRRRPPQRIPFPAARYRRRNFPFRGQFINLMPQVPIYFDRRTRQTIIYSPTGGFYIIPPLVNTYGQLFSVAELIASGYASLVSSGVPPGGPIDAGRFFLPTPLIGGGIPRINSFSGGFQGGVRTDYGRFSIRKRPETLIDLYSSHESEEEDDYEPPSPRPRPRPRPSPSYERPYVKPPPPYKPPRTTIKRQTTTTSTTTKAATAITNPTTQTPKVDFEALQNAVSELQRQSLLTDGQFVFDFNNSLTMISQGKGGRTVAATATNFPALIGHGVAMTVGFIGPCGINLPHTHPRATEINFILAGTFQAGLFQENNARFIMNTLSTGQATVFPQGGIHFEQNLNCTPATFVAAFNSADPGVQTIANSFYGGLPANVVGASLGGLNITTVESMKAMLPTNPALGIAECRQRCGL